MGQSNKKFCLDSHRGQEVFLPSKVHTGSGAHAASYSKDIRGTSPRGKALHFAKPVQLVDVEGLQNFPFLTVQQFRPIALCLLVIILDMRVIARSFLDLFRVFSPRRVGFTTPKAIVPLPGPHQPVSGFSLGLLENHICPRDKSTLYFTLVTA